MTVSSFAPGRIEFLGNHTDYNRGRALAGAIDRGITITGTLRDDRLIVLEAGERVEISLDDLRPQTHATWANYPLGVVAQWQRAGHRLAGFEATIASNLPAGLGLGSSAALEVATAGLLMRLHGSPLPSREVARLCQRAENEFVGVASGMLDQAASIYGRANHLVHLDFATEEFRAIPFPRGLGLIVASSGATHELARSHYNTRRTECALAAKSLGVPDLRGVTLEQLENAALEPTLRRRALHIAGENLRVERARAALSANDDTALGELLNASHESSRVNFANSTRELDALAADARKIPGVLGARLTGGGFGGAIIVLVRQAAAAEVANALATRTGQRDGGLICRLAEGAAAGW